MGGPTETSQEEMDKQIEMFKVKKLIKNLEAARGNGTSMISLIIHQVIRFHVSIKC